MFNLKPDAMPTISTFYGIIIQMFWDDHAPPHFHAKYAGEKGVIDITKLALIEGQLPPQALKLVLKWARTHQNELLEDWKLCALQQMPKKIEPLK